MIYVQKFNIVFNTVLHDLTRTTNNTLKNYDISSPKSVRIGFKPSYVLQLALTALIEVLYGSDLAYIPGINDRYYVHGLCTQY
jgi:hypothetical protein